jgi:hypothetical protein
VLVRRHLEEACLERQSPAPRRPGSTSPQRNAAPRSPRSRGRGHNRPDPLRPLLRHTSFTKRSPRKPASTIASFCSAVQIRYCALCSLNLFLIVGRAAHPEPAAGRSPPALRASGIARRSKSATCQRGTGAWGTIVPTAVPSSSRWSKSASVRCSARPARIWNRTRQPEWRSTPSGRSSGTSRPSQVCVDARSESG